MEAHPCPKCNHPMDEGYPSLSSATLGYVSQKQKGMLKTVTTLKRARACPNCGYVELYLDPNELRARIS